MTAISVSVNKCFRWRIGIRVLFCLLMIGGMLGLTCSSAQAVVYVDKDATSGANNGLSWANAYTNLKNALNNTVSGEIWVADGTYYPTTNPDPASETDRTLFFLLDSGIFLYGGFNGTETLLTERDPIANVTILSGDIASTMTSDNTYHVVVSDASVTSPTSAVLDGFTIRDGNANFASGDNNYGGGMFNYGSPTISNCIFTGNLCSGGGAAIYNADNTAPLISKCAFSFNRSSLHGGGVHNGLNTNPRINSCSFNGNRATESGGGVSFFSGIPKLTNCTFFANQANGHGGGVV